MVSPNIDVTLSCALSTVSGAGAFTVIAGASSDPTQTSGITVRSVPNVLLGLASSPTPKKTFFRNRSECRPAKHDVLVARRGLPGGRVGPGNGGIRCVLYSRKVYIHVQGTLRHGRLQLGKLAITTKPGKPVIFATVRRGAISLFASNACAPSAIG